MDNKVYLDDHIQVSPPKHEKLVISNVLRLGVGHSGRNLYDVVYVVRAAEKISKFLHSFFANTAVVPWKTTEVLQKKLSVLEII